MQTQPGDDEKDRYRTCCAVCHIKFGTVVLGVIEVAVCIAVLISATQQVVWKTGGSQLCSDNILRDCLIFQFSHFNVTLIFDYIVIIMMICILFSGDLYTQRRPFTFNNFVERMWLATLLLALATFQTYLFSAVIRCSMYISVSCWCSFLFACTTCAERLKRGNSRLEQQHA
ncbi:hypothetical protein ANCCAN_23500 [Ancylostoma caninum]|uniref:Uncharacterized protein n=1 Tax=Ancylostoma caninum TaxID=29170 RepID=A0A368FKN5_ANCCA|nr:hypothetical protein ANCCAN_23500 [Ancylostoma caninum]